MKVLHLAAGNLFGGVETYLLTLARLRHLCPTMEPHFGVCFKGRLRDELVGSGVPVHDLGAVRASRPWSVCRGRQRLSRLIRNQKIDVAITHGSWPHAILGRAVRKTRARLLNCVHDSLLSGHWLNHWAARTPPDKVIANSQFTASTVPRVFRSCPVEVCYLPVAAPDFENREAIRQEVRAELRTSSDAVVIMQASRLEEWKGQTIHLEALTRLKDDPGWVAWIAGGPQKEGEAAFLANLQVVAKGAGIADRVRFLGQRPDVQRLMIAADIYCQPNTGPEPFGIALVEALYAGLPVVTSSCGGAIEIVKESCGALCPPGDVTMVSAALRRLIVDSNTRWNLGTSGRLRARDLCEPQHQLAVFADAIARLAKVNAPNS